MSSAQREQHNALLEGDRVDLSRLFSELWGHKWLILIISAITLALGVFHVAKLVPQYSSNLLLQIEPGQSRFISNDNAMQTFMTSGKVADTVSTQMALIKSRFILEPVIRQLGLDVQAVPERRFWDKFSLSLPKKKIHIQTFIVSKQYINQSFSLVYDAPKHFKLYDAKKHLILQGQIGTLVENKNKTMQIQVKAIQAPLRTHFSVTKRATHSLVQGLSRQLKIEEVGEKSRQYTGILDLSLTGEDPGVIVSALNAIAKETQIKDAEKKSQEASQTLEFLNQQLPLTKQLLEKAETVLNRYRAKSGKIDLKLQTQFLLHQLSEQDHVLDELKLKRINMMQQYTQLHPQTIALNTEITALERRRVTLERQLKLLPASDQVAVNLLRDVNVKKTLYLLLLNKIQELEVIKAGTVSSVRILSFAKPVDSPIPKPRFIVYLGCLFFGVFLSAALILGRKLISPRVDDPHWGEREFNLATLAIIPFSKEQVTLTSELDISKHLPLLAHTNPRNLSVESLRSLRTSLQVSLTCANNNLVSILGVLPNVGKSFVSANLAYLLATAGKRILLLDADLRRGSLHKYMNCPASPGLVEVLKNTVSLEDAVSSTMHDNLFILPRGAYPTDPSELLTGEAFKVLMNQLSQQYDLVIIDTAPVLLVTDAVVVGGYTATNYLVVGAGTHQPREIEMVLKRLSGSGVSVHGSIYNFHRERKKLTNYGNYHYYASHYSYYYDESSNV